jgi:hypothetical protein
MKRYSAWLAFGLLLFVVLACNLSKNKNSNVNINSGTNRPAKAEVYTDEVYAAKSEDGAATSTFSPSDRTVHVIAKLNKSKSGTDMKFVWIAADVEGQTDKELRTMEYTTKPIENKISAYLRWPQNWPRGRYKVEIHINGALDRTIYYEVQ